MSVLMHAEQTPILALLNENRRGRLSNRRAAAVEQLSRLSRCAIGVAMSPGMAAILLEVSGLGAVEGSAMADDPQRIEEALRVRRELARLAYEGGDAHTVAFLLAHGARFERVTLTWAESSEASSRVIVLDRGRQRVGPFTDVLTQVLRRVHGARRGIYLFRTRIGEQQPTPPESWSFGIQIAAILAGHRRRAPSWRWAAVGPGPQPPSPSIPPGLRLLLVQKSVDLASGFDDFRDCGEDGHMAARIIASGRRARLTVSDPAVAAAAIEAMGATWG